MPVGGAPSTVADIFDQMSYGPATEQDDIAQLWLESHGRSFGHYVNNEWRKPEGRKFYECKNPANGKILANTMQGEQGDIDVAVAAAKTALPSWSALSGPGRARHLYSIARHVQQHSRLIAVLEAMDNGKTFRETRDADVAIVIRHLYYYAGWAQLADEEMRNWKAVGVIGGIVPWNFPLMLLIWKVAPALAMGNTVVLKPATYTRLSALLFAEICAEAGLPKGVFNVVTGGGAMGSMLAAHSDVDKVAFTGSTEIGQLLRRLTAGTGKKLSLELGGKSPVVVFDSADLDAAVEGVVDAVWFNQGQVCSAGSRLLVQDTVYDKVIAKIKERLTHFRVGDSLDKAVDMGAIVDESQRQSVKDMVEEARREGAEIYQVTDVPKGCFYPPTLITNVSTVSRIVQEEVFGPVLVAMSFRTQKEGLALANNTRYGLAGSVWTENLAIALESALSIKAGAIWVNSHNLFDAAAGFGGYRESGFGRDGGKEGLYEYVKPVWETSVRLDTPLDVKTFGAITKGRPSDPVNKSDGVPTIDHTFKFFYGGSQKRPDGMSVRAIKSPKGEVLGHVGDGNRKDVRNAVEAAHAGAAVWGKRAAFNRSQILYFLAENLERRREEFVTRLAALTAQSVELARKEVDASVARVFYWAAWADKYGGEVQETTLYGATVKVHEPVGVIGICCPDEQPLLSFVSLFAPAIVRANSVVIVPSEKFPLLALEMYSVFETSDVPAGVINLLTGDRDHLAKHLVEHQDVQAMWYFGSSEGSKYVEMLSAENLKRTWVNLGRQRDWFSAAQGQGEEFLYQCTQVKNIWLPMGDIFAN